MVINPVMPATGLAKGALVKVRQHAGAERQSRMKPFSALWHRALSIRCPTSLNHHLSHPIPPFCCWWTITNCKPIIRCVVSQLTKIAHENQRPTICSAPQYQIVLRSKYGPCGYRELVAFDSFQACDLCAVCIFSRARVQRTSSSVPRATRPRRYACSCRRMGSRALSNIRYPT